MFHTALIMFQLTHQSFMKMSEIWVNNCVFVNNYNIKLIKIHDIIEIYMILYVFSMHRTIIVNVRLFSEVPADMPARPKKSYSQPHYFRILSTFLYDF